MLPICDGDVTTQTNVTFLLWDVEAYVTGKTGGTRQFHVFPNSSSRVFHTLNKTNPIIAKGKPHSVDFVDEFTK